MDSDIFRQIMPAEFHRRFLVKNKRADGRLFHSYRQPTVATNILSNCSGSASVRCGNSYYLAGVRCEVGRPVEIQGIQWRCTDLQSPSLLTESGSRVRQTRNTSRSTTGSVPDTIVSETFSGGQVSVSVEFSKVCGAEFRDSGGPCTQIPLLVSGIVTDLLNSPAVIDKRQFVFWSSRASSGTAYEWRTINSQRTEYISTSRNASKGAASAAKDSDAVPCSETAATAIDDGHTSGAPAQYAWYLFIHVLCLEYDGNPLDYAVLAAVAALEDTCLPGIFWDKDANWWRQVPCSVEHPSIAVASDSNNTSSEAEDSKSEMKLCYIPPRKVHLLDRPVAVTFSHLLSTYWVVDPTREEEALGCWLSICVISDRWEITRFGGPPVKFEVLAGLKTVAAVIAKGIKRLVKVSDENA